MSVIVTSPLIWRFAVGVNVTLIVQAAPGASDAMLGIVEHVVPGAKAKLPLPLSPESISGVVPVFFSMTDFGALVVPVF